MGQATAPRRDIVAGRTGCKQTLSITKIRWRKETFHRKRVQAARRRLATGRYDSETVLDTVLDLILDDLTT